MTLRITLLVLATGLFALIWTNDRPAPKTRQAAPLAQSTQRAELGAVVSSDGTANAGTQIEEMKGQAVSHFEPVLPMPVVPQDEAWMFNDCQMPLPEGIVPGEYRAVSHTGIVREFKLTLEDLKTYRGGNARFQTRDIYQSETETHRWYFIRVQTDSAEVLPVIAARGGHIMLPALAERSENKRLQQQASQIIVNAGQKLTMRLIRLVQSDSPARISTDIQDRIRL